MKRLIFCLTFLLQPQGSWSASNTKSGAYIDVSLFPVYVSRNDTSSVTTSPGVATESGIGFDTSSSLGYLFANDLFIGVTYNYYKLTTSRPYVSGGDSSLDESTEKISYGPSIGYMPHYWRFILTVLLDGSKSVSTKNGDNTGTTGDVTITNNKLAGMQASVGYGFSAGTSFEISPALIIRSASYTNQSKRNKFNAIENYSDQSLFTKALESTITPYIALSWKF